MNRILLLSLAGIAFPIFLFSQTVTIGTQVWSTQNLDVSTFRNGDTIPEVRTPEEWIKAGAKMQPAWCYANNDPAMGVKYGKLYNWYAIHDPRGLAPMGWHIPDRKELLNLVNYLGGMSEASPKIKSSEGWCEKSEGNNSSGFTALPGGIRHANGQFSNIGKEGGWGSSEEDYDFHVYVLSLDCRVPDDYAIIAHFPWNCGVSVRCVKN